MGPSFLPSTDKLIGFVSLCNTVLPNTWLKCAPPFRTTLLDLLELVLLQRAYVFHKLPQLTVALRQKVGTHKVHAWVMSCSNDLSGN